MMVGRRYVHLAAVLQLYIVNLFLVTFVPVVSLVIRQMVNSTSKSGPREYFCLSVKSPYHQLRLSSIRNTKSTHKMLKRTQSEPRPTCNSPKRIKLKDKTTTFACVNNPLVLSPNHRTSFQKNAIRTTPHL